MAVTGEQQQRKKLHRGAGAKAALEAARAAGVADIAPPVPERRCVVTGATHPTDALIRFALGPDGVVPDLTGRLPGRGVWIEGHVDRVAEAVRKKAFARGFKQAVTCPADLAETVDTLLRRRAVERISIANKAGLAIAGFSKVETVLREGTIAVLLHASDAAEDGCRKLDALARIGVEITGNDPKIISQFTCDELSLAFGRGNVVHAALKQGGASASFLKDLMRYENYAAGAEAVDSTTDDGTETRDRRNTERE